MDNIFESIAAATKPLQVSLNDDAMKVKELNAKLLEVVNSYQFETIEGLEVKKDTLMGLDIMAKTFTLKCKP